MDDDVGRIENEDEFDISCVWVDLKSFAKCSDSSTTSASPMRRLRLVTFIIISRHNRSLTL